MRIAIWNYAHIKPNVICRTATFQSSSLSRHNRTAHPPGRLHYPARPSTWNLYRGLCDVRLPPAGFVRCCLPPWPWCCCACAARVRPVPSTTIRKGSCVCDQSDTEGWVICCLMAFLFLQDLSEQPVASVVSSERHGDDGSRCRNGAERTSRAAGIFDGLRIGHTGMPFMLI